MMRWSSHRVALRAVFHQIIVIQWIILLSGGATTEDVISADDSYSPEKAFSSLSAANEENISRNVTEEISSIYLQVNNNETGLSEFATQVSDQDFFIESENVSQVNHSRILTPPTSENPTEEERTAVPQRNRTQDLTEMRANERSAANANLPIANPLHNKSDDFSSILSNVSTNETGKPVDRRLNASRTYSHIHKPNNLLLHQQRHQQRDVEASEKSSNRSRQDDAKADAKPHLNASSFPVTNASTLASKDSVRNSTTPSTPPESKPASISPADDSTQNRSSAGDFFPPVIKNMNFPYFRPGGKSSQGAFASSLNQSNHPAPNGTTSSTAKPSFAAETTLGEPAASLDGTTGSTQSNFTTFFTTVVSVGVPSSYVSSVEVNKTTLVNERPTDDVNGTHVSTVESLKAKDLLGIGAIVGIVLGVLGVVVIVGGIFGFLIYHRRFRSLSEIKYPTDNCGYIDDSLRVSYINNHIELPKESSEEMFSLDNDSFLNSLEAMTLQNYWAEDAKNTKV